MDQNIENVELNFCENQILDESDTELKPCSSVQSYILGHQSYLSLEANHKIKFSSIDPLQLKNETYVNDEKNLNENNHHKNENHLLTTNECLNNLNKMNKTPNEAQEIKHFKQKNESSSNESSPLDKKVSYFSKSELPILITGPSGSGKSTLARKIHEKSERKNEAFIVVNLAELHEGTIESELFGHERGSFTGANNRKKGLLELANNGTVFLDEISELNIKYQARLLEFLQSSCVRPVGGSLSKKLNIRIICATNRDLDDLVKNNLFREDLLYRIRVLSVELLGLHDPNINFDSLIHEMLDKISKREKKIIHSIEEKFVEKLETYSWPGNFRELEHLLEAAVVNAENAELKFKDLPSWFLRKYADEQKDINSCVNLTKLIREYLSNKVGKSKILLTHEEMMTEMELGYIEWATEYCKKHEISLCDMTELSSTTLWRIKNKAKKRLKNRVFEKNEKK